MRYTTYFEANCFEVMIGKDICCIDMIDGGCDVVINGPYSVDKNREQLYLYLYALRDFSLWKNPWRGPTERISRYVVKAESMLCFDISRKKKKS